MTTHHYAERLAKIGDRRFLDKIFELETRADEYRAEAGRYGDQCEFTQRVLQMIAKEISEVESLAYDRYDDLQSDPI